MPDVELIGLHRTLADPSAITADPFSVAKSIANICATSNYDIEAQDLVIRSLENLDAFGNARPILNSLVRECGLFPYVDLDFSSTNDLFAAALHRYSPLGEDFLLHREQRNVLSLLLSKRSVVLSAPTSFGKSVLIDAVLAAKIYDNVLIVVPTIALMDEARRRLTRLFAPEWKVITHLAQTKRDKNIFILTPERADLAIIGKLDFFVIDEFYKLGHEAEQDRLATLNKLCYRLLQRKIPFFMLGPNIEGIPEELAQHCAFERKDYKTVAVNVTLIDADPVKETIALCNRLRDSTIVFCRSPTRAIEISESLITSGVTSDNKQSQIASDWASQAYDPGWHYARALAHGIGVHHASIPRSLAYWAVRAFNRGWLKFLVCTTTLIEGVNTRAKSLIILDSKVDKKDITFFTFNNIKGRAGRMMQHFVGDVYTFANSPQEELPFVDLPIFTQPPNTPTSILLGLDSPDLTAQSQARIKSLSQNGTLSLEFLKRSTVDPELQIAAARRMLEAPEYWIRQFSWTSSYPKWPQLAAINELIWETMGGKFVRGSVYTPGQLTKFTFDLIRRDLKRMISEFKSEAGTADEGVQRTNSFLRNWATFHFPKFLILAGDIAQEVVAKGVELSNYTAFALSVERLFYDAGIVALDEYGIPLPLAAKLESRLAADNSIDGTLEKLRNLNIDGLNLHQFERGLIRVARESLR